LNAGGFLVYATCSVFSAENEDQTAYFQQHFGLELIGENYYDGFAMGADTLFSAVFKKP
jgi:16S rRNA (cytosine967-C5)-methyltransferase